jgi:hypothetical protein
MTFVACAGIALVAAANLASGQSFEKKNYN